MPKKHSPLVVDHSQGFIMTDEGLLIPGKFLRKMGKMISVTFSPRLIVISAPHSPRRTQESARKSASLDGNRRQKKEA
jgi:hypothetical protein